MIYKYAKKKNYEIAKAAEIAIISFTDIVHENNSKTHEEKT